MAVRNEGHENSDADFEELSIASGDGLVPERFNFVRGPNGIPAVLVDPALLKVNNRHGGGELLQSPKFPGWLGPNVKRDPARLSSAAEVPR